MDDWKARILLWKATVLLKEQEKQGELFPPEEKKKIEDANEIARRKLEELQRNAHKKVPPKKPILDDDGDPIPF